MFSSVGSSVTESGSPTGYTLRHLHAARWWTLPDVLTLAAAAAVAAAPPDTRRGHQLHTNGKTVN